MLFPKPFYDQGRKEATEMEHLFTLRQQNPYLQFSKQEDV